MPGLEALLKGRELAGRYRIDEVIGRGGMGAVYRATDLRLGRPVAVKVITASSGNDPELRERLRARFRHEAASAARLPHHPNVVPVYDYGTDEDLGLDYIVMELLRGEDLATRFQRGSRMPLAEALRILQHASRGVAVGHRAGLVHRDVKPGNIFLVQGEHDDDEMQVRVLDFGIAKAMAEEDTTALTHDGRAPMSPAYASPEQLRAEPRLSPASDVFSLGAVGFQLLTGERPYTETDRNRMSAGLDVPTPSMRSRAPGIPEEVEAVIRRALAPDAVQRFANAGQMADALEQPLRRLGETPAAAVIPAGGALPPMDDDRTMIDGGFGPADDDRTVLAPPARRPAVPPPPPPFADRAGGNPPVIAQPRRRQTQVAEERSGVHPLVWVLLALLLIGGGAFALSQMGGGGGNGAVAADSAAVDSAGADSLTADDALVLSQEWNRFFRMQQYDSALAYAERAMAISPRTAEYRDQAAVALMRLGRYSDAADVLTEGIRMEGRYDLFYSHLAEARLAMGDTTSAIIALKQFVEITPAAADRAKAQQSLRILEQQTQPPPLEPVPGVGDSVPAVPGNDPSIPATDTIRPRPGGYSDTLRMGGRG
ncbi:protein kinase domain-containing protein [Longimicrobium terrae]|uniref:tRNA A-37 threonylcarbamoyl transferase component Bud32 n=1 Tax=Longimicrobium terrae TaxID=1639882 RepID=A0A841GYJ3_9BACT|nr:serine/threonine-protein kinase [Longimicrobium terrae]MBB4636621.1 tRNA A-37 threonylcarbamoyl transferase component Bud32 [Longimicrobium terrae]MBB6070855.1 tRNA A-37 threonylcarbamoyl transferase component Bud32 [Longimicrobium terrae]NNC28880.1 protein kinase [Longimicrobium terrae]